MKQSSHIYPLIISLMIPASYSCKNFHDSREKEIPPPNILLCIADDASWMHMSAYGCSWIETPAFDYVAQNGILFNNAYTPNAKCAPSRACMLTGRNSWQLEEAGNHMPFFPIKFKTVTEALAENGFHVGYTGKGYVPGIALNYDGTPRELLVKKYDQQNLEPPTTGIYPNNYIENFKDFLDEKPDKSPFFFWYGGWEPHRPYEYESGIKLGGMQLKDVDIVPAFWPDVDSVRTDMLDYAYELQYFDMHLGYIIEELRKRGQLENTLIIVTADNGMPFPRVKGQSYELSNHLPLAIMWLGGIRNVGRVIDDYVNFIDFAPTFLELAKISEEESGMKPITGNSLSNIFFSKKSGQVDTTRNYVLIGKERHDVGRPNDLGYPIRGIVKDEFLYLYNFETNRWPVGNPETGYLNCDGSPTKTVCLNSRGTGHHQYWELNFGKRVNEELFNIKNDPFCMVNLSPLSSYKDIRKDLQKMMFHELTLQEDPRMINQGHIFDQYPVCFDDLRGYYERFMKGENVQAGWVNETDYEKQNRN